MSTRWQATGNALTYRRGRLTITRCIIHIGMHKTGSTSIQHSLASLDNATHLYANIRGGSNHGLNVFTAFAKRPEHHPKNRRRGLDGATMDAYVREIRKDLRSAIRLAEGRTLLISGESLTNLDQAGVARLKAFFDKHSVDTEIAAYVRGPASFMSSSFQQQLKSGKLRRFDPGQVFPAYRSLLEKIDAVFGRNKVHLWKFDPPRFPEGSVVQDFCNRLGIEFGSIQEVRKNDSLSRELSGILYSYARWSRERGGLIPNGKDAARLAMLLSDLPATRFRLAPSVVRRVLEANSEEIGWMEWRLGESLAEDLGEDRESDVAGEDDLLKPVPGTANLLARALKDAGHEIPEIAGDDINPLIEIFLKSGASPRQKRRAKGRGRE